MINEKDAIELSKNYGSMTLLTACIMRNNNVDFKTAEDLVLRLNSSDYVFDRFIEDQLDALESDLES